MSLEGPKSLYTLGQYLIKSLGNETPKSLRRLTCWVPGTGRYYWQNKTLIADEKGEFSLSTPSSAVAPIAASSLGIFFNIFRILGNPCPRKHSKVSHCQKQKCNQLLTPLFWNRLPSSWCSWCCDSILFRLLAHVTTSSWVKLLQQPIINCHLKFLELTVGTKWIPPCERKWKTAVKRCLKLCAFLFAATCAFGKILEINGRK